MKLLCFILSLFSLLSTKVYITQKEKFLNTINSAYEEYEVFEKELSVGTLIISKGKVEETETLSLYFETNESKKYNLVVKEDRKTFTMSKDDYQIFYNIKLKESSTYKIVISQSGLTYYEISLSDITFTSKVGEGNNDFPYTTKLKNKLPTLVYIFILLEAVVIILIIMKKKSKQKTIVETSNNITYNSMGYEVVGDEHETK